VAGRSTRGASSASHFAFFPFSRRSAAETSASRSTSPEGTRARIGQGTSSSTPGEGRDGYSPAEDVELITSSALIVTLFFGGYAPVPPTARGHGRVRRRTLVPSSREHLASRGEHRARFFARRFLMGVLGQIFFRWNVAALPLRPSHEARWTKLLPDGDRQPDVTGVVVLAVEYAGGVRDELPPARDVRPGARRAGAICGRSALVAGAQPSSGRSSEGRPRALRVGRRRPPRPLPHAGVRRS